MIGKVPRLVEILCDGGTQGIGHIRRSSALGRALKARGLRSRVTALSDDARRLLPSCPSDPGKPSLVVFDLPYEISPYLEETRKFGLPAVALDYFGDAGPDLTISLMERPAAPRGNRLSGLKYAVVRSEVAALKPVEPGNGVLVAFCAGDSWSLGRNVSTLLSGLGAQVTWSQGPLDRGDSAVSPNILQLKNPADLPERMASCAWAVTNGGVTMMELLHLGKAVHVVSLTGEEERLADHLLELGCILGSGLETLRVPAPERARAVGKAARCLIDGQGLTRISQAIEGFLG